MKVLEQTTPIGVMTILQHGNVTLGITTQKGIRISYISAFDSDNLCFHDDKLTEVTNLEKGEKWYQLGGHRIWKSPEDLFCYYDDNLPAAIKVEENGAIVTSQCHRDGLQYSIRITFSGESSVKVLHAIKNCGDTPQKIAVWGITALDPKGWVEMIFDNDNGALLPNRNVVLWSYTDLDKGYVNVENDKITVFNNGNLPQKVGCFTKKGITYYRDDISFEISAATKDGQYPDYGCNYECYANGKLTEIESLSPIFTLKKGETASHVENWRFKQDK